MRASGEKTMDFKCRVAVTVLAALAAGATGVASAADDEGRDERPMRTLYEVTPFAGFRLAGDLDLANSNQRANLDDHNSFGLALGVRRDAVSMYELFYSRQETQVERTSPVAPLDVNVEYLHLGGTLDAEVDSDFPLHPFISGGLGLTRLTLQSGTDDTRFSLSVGGGLRVPVTARFNIRLEARGYVTLVDSDSAIFCASGSFGGVCSIRSNGSTFTQFELLAGASFAF